MKPWSRLLFAVSCAALLLPGVLKAQHAGHAAPAEKSPSTQVAAASRSAQDVAYQADVVYSLRTSISDGKLVFIGLTGSITD